MNPRLAYWRVFDCDISFRKDHMQISTHHECGMKICASHTVSVHGCCLKIDGIACVSSLRFSSPNYFIRRMVST